MKGLWTSRRRFASSLWGSGSVKAGSGCNPNTGTLLLILKFGLLPLMWRPRLVAAWPREAATLSGKLMGPWDPSCGSRRRIVFALAKKGIMLQVFQMVGYKQGYGSVIFWDGSGSLDPGPDPWMIGSVHWITDPDPEPWIRTLDYGWGSGSGSFRQWLSRCKQKLVLKLSFFWVFTYCRYIYNSRQRKQVIKKSQNS